ncbi:MAG: BglII/BstYI family type II restriction endonuclease [bacterium]|nr:BglII/BstYI family type II restriction endonuclease [bacterium]
MKVVYIYSHLGGAEILQVRYPVHLKEIYQVISIVKAKRTKVSEEKTMKGKLLYDPSGMNDQFNSEFKKMGYTKLKETYTRDIPNSDIKLEKGSKEIDFVKGKVLIEVQFGKYFSMFYDMSKFQYFFNENKTDVGVEIVPSHSLFKEMSTGVSYGEQLITDIERLRRHYPAVPVMIILIDVD